MNLKCLIYLLPNKLINKNVLINSLIQRLNFFHLTASVLLGCFHALDSCAHEAGHQN